MANVDVTGCTEDQQLQRLRRKVEDAEMARYLRTGAHKQIERVATWSCRNGDVRVFAEQDEPDMFNRDVNVPLPCDAFTMQLAGDTSWLTPEQKARGDRPATDRMIRRLAPVRATQEHIDLDSQCPVCADDISVGDILYVLPACQHYFHRDCITTWLKQHWTCAVCRTPLRFTELGKSRLGRTYSPMKFSTEPQQNSATGPETKAAQPKQKSANKKRRDAKRSAKRNATKQTSENTAANHPESNNTESDNTESNNTVSTITTENTESITTERVICSYDCPVRVCILAYVDRDTTQIAGIPPLVDTLPPAVYPLLNLKTKQPYGKIVRFSRSVNLEIIRYIFDVPSTARNCDIHVEVPASAALVHLEVRTPVYFQRVVIETTAEKENISASEDLACVIMNNGGQNMNIVVAIPACPDIIQEFGGERVTPPRVVDWEVDDTTYNVLSSIVFQDFYNEVKAFMYR